MIGCEKSCKYKMFSYISILDWNEGSNKLNSPYLTTVQIAKKGLDHQISFSFSVKHSVVAGFRVLSDAVTGAELTLHANQKNAHFKDQQKIWTEQYVGKIVNFSTFSKASGQSKQRYALIKKFNLGKIYAQYDIPSLKRDRYMWGSYFHCVSFPP